MLTRSVLLTTLLILISLNVSADGIEVDPGKWEMTTTMSMPMLPQPKVTTVTECIEEGEISPESMSDEMDPDCIFDAQTVDGNTMKWSMVCNTGEGSSRGEWEATSYGDTMTGDGTITIDVQGQNMVMTMDWSGKWIGACD